MGGGPINPCLPNTIPTTPSSSYDLLLPSPFSSSNPRVTVSANPQSQTPGGASSSAFPGGSGMVSNSVLGLVPTKTEVEKAISALLGFWNGTSSESWMHVFGSDPRVLISNGLERLCHALHLLQTEPAVKMLVISLASDRAFWDAVMNNEAVRKVQELLSTGENGRPRISGNVDLNRSILSWFLEMLREKIMELTEKFKSLVNELIQPSTSKKQNAESKAELAAKVMSSFLLSVVIHVIVVLARITVA